MKQYNALLVMLIFSIANDCYAFDLGVLENTNKKELVLAVFLEDGEAAKPPKVLKQPKTPKPQPIEPKPPKDSEPIEPTPPKPRPCLRFQGACFFGD